MPLGVASRFPPRGALRATEHMPLKSRHGRDHFWHRPWSCEKREPLSPLPSSTDEIALPFVDFASGGGLQTLARTLVQTAPAERLRVHDRTLTSLGSMLHRARYSPAWRVTARAGGFTLPHAPLSIQLLNRTSSDALSRVKSVVLSFSERTPSCTRQAPQVSLFREKEGPCRDEAPRLPALPFFLETVGPSKPLRDRPGASTGLAHDGHGERSSRKAGGGAKSAAEFSNRNSRIPLESCNVIDEKQLSRCSETFYAPPLARRAWHAIAKARPPLSPSLPLGRTGIRQAASRLLTLLFGWSLARRSLPLARHQHGIGVLRIGTGCTPLEASPVSIETKA